MKNFDINQINKLLNFNKRYCKEETLEEQMKKVEELYPNCFEDVEFARYIAEHKNELEGLHLDHLIGFFEKDSQDVMISYCDYNELYGVSHEIHNKLENEIIENLSKEGYEALNLSDDVWIDYVAAFLPRAQAGKENVEGFRMTIMENEYDDDGLNPQAFSSPVGIFVPLDNFEDARIDYWNEAYLGQKKDWEEKLTPLLEAVKNQRLKNIKEIYKEIYKENQYFTKIRKIIFSLANRPPISDKELEDILEEINETLNIVLEGRNDDPNLASMLIKYLNDFICDEVRYFDYEDETNQKVIEEYNKISDNIVSKIISEPLSQNEEFAFDVIKGTDIEHSNMSKFILKRLSPQLLENTDFCIKILEVYGFLLEDLPEYKRNEKDVVLAAVEYTHNKDVLKYASKELQNDKEFMEYAMKFCTFEGNDLEDDNHNILEIKETISDRNVSDINKVVSEIVESNKDKKEMLIGD